MEKSLWYVNDVCRYMCMIQAKLSEAELLSGYARAVDVHLARLSLPSITSLTSSPNLIDSLLDRVTDILHSAAQAHVPALPFKPGWTPELQRHHSKSKKLHKEWVKVGCPRSHLNPARKRYKEAKAAFRALLR